MLAITDLGTNTHLAKQATNTMAPEIASRLPYGSIMESSHIVKLHLPVVIKPERKIHIFPQMKTAPVVSLGLLCDDGCTNTLDKQEMSVHNNVQEIIKGRRNKKTGMW